MNDLGRRLHDSDPVRHEPGLSRDDLAGMRRAIVVSAHAASAPGFRWPAPLAVAALVALVAGIGAVAARRLPAGGVAPEAAVSTAPAAAPKRTQVQFSTPGGTRIIWTIDPAFQLKSKR